MPASYAFDDGVLWIAFVDKTPLTEIEQLLDQALADPSCPLLPSTLVDVRRSASLPERTADEVQAAVGLFEQRRDRFARHAILTTYGARFAMMRMAGAYGESAGLELGVFTEEVEARRWLRESDAD